MRRHWDKRALLIIPIVILASSTLGFLVMQLWNWLMPAVFGLGAISFWQALGLLVLSRILLGRFPGRRGGGGMRWRRRMMERWERMTPEEREKFREGMRGHCGGFQWSVEPKSDSPAV